MNEPESFVLTNDDEIIPLEVKREIKKKPIYKHIWFLIILLVCLLILGTVHWDFDISDLKREKYSDEAIKAATATIMYSEQYFDGTITAEQAQVYIQNVTDELNMYHELDSENSRTYWDDSVICSKLSLVSLLYINEKYFGGNIAEIKEEVDFLREEIRYK